MKTTRYSLLFSLVSISLLYTSCEDPCSGRKNEYIHLSDEEKSKIPYTGHDTLRFVNTIGDTTIITTRSKQFEYCIESSSGDAGDCGNMYKENESISVLFKSNTPSFSYTSIRAHTGLRCQSFESNFSITIGYVSFNSDLALLNESYYQDTLTIKGKLYKGINITGYKDSLSSVFYNHTDGILRIILSKNGVWIKQ